MIIGKTVTYKQFINMWNKNDCVDVTFLTPNITRVSMSFKTFVEFINEHRREGYTIRSIGVSTDYYVNMNLDHKDDWTKSIVLLAVLIK